MPATTPSTLTPKPCPSAWLHNPSLSVWLSVDPLSDKYPGVSPYAYCAGNPIRITDPDGRDWWEVNRSGYFQHVEGSEGYPDKLFAVKGHEAKHFSKITDKTVSMQIDAEIMNQVIDSQTEAIENSKGNLRVTVANRRSDMTSFFDFLADNTNVEWALASVCWPTGKGMDANEPRDILVTDHHHTEVSELQFTVSFGEKLECFRHNHPRRYSFETFLEPSLLNIVSNEDLKHMQACQEAGAICPFILRSNYKNKRYDE